VLPRPADVHMTMTYNEDVMVMLSAEHKVTRVYAMITSRDNGYRSIIQDALGSLAKLANQLGSRNQTIKSNQTLCQLWCLMVLAHIRYLSDKMAV